MEVVVLVVVGVAVVVVVVVVGVVGLVVVEVVVVVDVVRYSKNNTPPGMFIVNPNSQSISSQKFE